MESIPGEPARTAGGRDRPFLSLTWIDPVTGCAGYLVVDRLVRGVASGGLRMHPGCDRDEIRELAYGMSVKEALRFERGAAYVPLGGAKGGIDYDPRESGAGGVLRRYLKALGPLIERFWAVGEDLGVGQVQIDQMLDALGIGSCVQAVYPLLDEPNGAIERLAKAFTIVVDGMSLHELVGGCGVAESALAVLDRDGVLCGSASAAIQGFGTMGGACARFLAQAGVRVVAVADIHGTIANPAGLDVELLLRARDEHATIDRAALRPGDVELAPAEWADVDADILVPAAVSHCIGPHNQAAIKARYIVEAANMPVLAKTERDLLAKGITILPDMVANSGTNAWWWWTLFGDIEADPTQALDKVRTSTRQLITKVLDKARAGETSPRQAAHQVAVEHLQW